MKILTAFGVNMVVVIRFVVELFFFTVVVLEPAVADTVLERLAVPVVTAFGLARLKVHLW
jgi:hypothetical protein